MTLAELLEVNLAEIPPNCQRTIAYIQGCWTENGCPTEPTALAQFLDAKLKFCAEVQYRYPKIILKRLKQLQRKEWIPRVLEVQ